MQRRAKANATADSSASLGMINKSRGQRRLETSGEVLLEPWVVGVDEVVGGAFEMDFALVEDEKAGAVVDATVGDGLHFVRGVVPAVGGEGEGVLEAVGDEKCGGVGDVALLDDKLDDGGGGDGVQTAGGGVVEDEVGFGDDGAGDGDAAAHATGELGGELGSGVGEKDEVEDFFNALMGVVGGDAFFVEAVGDVVLDVEGVEEGGLLEDHADAVAELEAVHFAHGDDILAEDGDGAGVGQKEPVDELEEDRFAASGWAEDDELLAGGDGEGDVFEDWLDVEGDGDVFKLDYGTRVGAGVGLVEGLGGDGHG